MISISAEQMRQIDKFTIEEIGIPSIVLMENAKNAMMPYIPLDGYDNYVILAGVGNNGGDALAIGRDLALEEKDLSIFVVGDLNKGSKDFNINYNILKNIGMKIINIKGLEELEILKKKISIDSIIVDGIFGTGLNSDIRGIAVDVIETINNSKAFKFSVDIPSGMNADTGKIQGVGVNADYVVTLGLMKNGLKNYKGEISVEDIGIPKKSVNTILEKNK